MPTIAANNPKAIAYPVAYWIISNRLPPSARARNQPRIPPSRAASSISIGLATVSSASCPLLLVVSGEHLLRPKAARGSRQIAGYHGLVSKDVLTMAFSASGNDHAGKRARSHELASSFVA